jgi:uncharacterized damage-inducible protein DinB
MHLHSILRGAHSYLSPNATLAGLTTELASRRPHEAEHSIMEIVAHMSFWQEWFLDRCNGIATPAPARAELSWPSVADDVWESVHARFEAGFQRALVLADNEARTIAPITPPLEFGHLEKYTVADALIHMALHNAHHLGQVITLRQQSDAWPPPAGSWTW